jgi:exoribonuclease-2
LLTIPVEGRVVRGFEGIDVGGRIRVQLISVDVQRGYIDFTKVGSS